MKKLSSLFYKSFAVLILTFISTLSSAQIDVDIDLGNKQEWYEDPKVWIGVAVFLLVLVVISRFGKKTT